MGSISEGIPLMLLCAPCSSLGHCAGPLLEIRPVFPDYPSSCSPNHYSCVASHSPSSPRGSLRPASGAYPYASKAASFRCSTNTSPWAVRPRMLPASARSQTSYTASAIAFSSLAPPNGTTTAMRICKFAVGNRPAWCATLLSGADLASSNYASPPIYYYLEYEHFTAWA